MDPKRETALARRLGKALADARRRSALTQPQVAERLGIGNEAISRIERGLIMPTVARLIEFAEIYDCNVSELLVRSSDRPRDESTALGAAIEHLSPRDRATVRALVEHLAGR